jgi:hypothetical protein
MKSLSNGLGDDYVIFVDYDFKAEEQEKPELVKDGPKPLK